MTNSRLSVDAMCTYPWSFAQDLALWSSTGVRHAGLLAFKLGDDPAARMAELTAAGIRCSTIITASFDLLAPDSWDSTRAAQCHAIDLAAAEKGHSIYFTPGRTTCISWVEDLNRLAEAAAPTVAYAKQRGVLAAFEPSLRTNVSFINNLRDAIDAAERTGLSIVADFGNMWMERDFRETLARAMPYIALMQIGDMVIGSGGRPAPGGRAQIGKGELPLQRMLRDVLDAGYQGVFDLEVVPANAVAGCNEAELREGIEAASRLLDELGV
jgi:sugar phosphate isomerase/epimerase